MCVFVYVSVCVGCVCVCVCERERERERDGPHWVYSTPSNEQTLNKVLDRLEKKVYMHNALA